MSILKLKKLISDLKIIKIVNHKIKEYKTRDAGYIS